MLGRQNFGRNSHIASKHIACEEDGKQLDKCLGITRGPRAGRITYLTIVTWLAQVIILSYVGGTLKVFDNFTECEQGINFSWVNSCSNLLW